MTPLLRLREASAEPLAAGAWRVRVVVENAGWLPSNVTERAVERKAVRPLEATITLPDGAELASGSARLELGQLTGRALKQNTVEIAAVGDPTTDRAKAEWVVRGTAGAEVEVEVEVRHQRAGVVRCRIPLA
jgi:hypothetical protein